MKFSLQNPKLLYLMHIDWQWAKQRPHFIAEGLAGHFSVYVSFCFSYRRRLMNGAPAAASLRARPILSLPFQRLRLLKQLSRWLAIIQLAFRVRRASIIWITHPSMYHLVESTLGQRKMVIYDCMDDALEFPTMANDRRKIDELAALEARLVRRASVVFTSSRYLRSKLESRYGDGLNIHVVNNAASVALTGSLHREYVTGDVADLLGQAVNAPGKRILYIGTISEWFDFDLILHSLELVEGVSYILVGPCEITPPTHERLFVLPPVKHADVAKLMAWADALVMPFQLTELIRSVNPVKVYEYIASSKPALVLRYGETEIFDPYVHLYEGAQEFLKLVSNVAAGEIGAKVEVDAAQEFVQRNTWPARVGTILEHMAGR
jgi:teichuronic acid biosynthesis glycosyltransferase TuaH